jgi:DNA-binding LytR/AlgR family response regulator
MKRLRVLIVEDEPLIAMDLEATIAEIRPATVIVKPSLASTKEVLDELFDFAFLDVNVANGKTYELARLLDEHGVPFAFVSAMARVALPGELKVAPLYQAIPTFSDRASLVGVSAPRIRAQTPYSPVPSSLIARADMSTGSRSPV